jgi:hypothetical protein
MSAGVARVTVVTGVPRSGTSLVMQMLAAGGHPILSDGVRAADADNPLGYLEYEPAKRLRRDASWVALAHGRAVKLVHALVDALPDSHEYRLILVRRRLDEVLASQRVMLERSGQPIQALADERVAAVFREQLEGVVAWAQQREVPLHEVDHAELIEDPTGTARGIDAFLGGGLDAAAMALAIDPGLYRQRA